MKKYKKQVVIGVLIALFLVVIVPMIINACYSSETIIFPTVWDGEDVLAYYGTMLSTVLGSFITVSVLVATILFTQKQIKSDRQLQSEKEKWKRIETSIDSLLVSIQPLRYLSMLENIQKRNEVRRIDEWLDELRIKEDTIAVLLSTEDKEKISIFWEKLQGVKELVFFFVDSSRKYFAYCDFHQEDPDFEDEKNKKYDAMMSSFEVIHDGAYLKLLEQKRETFDCIYAEIEREAEKSLHFLRK